MSEAIDSIRKIAEQLYGKGYGGDVSAIERLTRENERLKAKAREDAKTIATLREARTKYRDAYLALKAQTMAMEGRG